MCDTLIHIRLSKYKRCSERQISCTSDASEVCRILAVPLSVSSMQHFNPGLLQNCGNGQFFSEQQPCILPRGEAVFLGRNREPPGILGGVLICKNFLKKSLSTS